MTEIPDRLPSLPAFGRLKRPYTVQGWAMDAFAASPGLAPGSLRADDGAALHQPLAAHNAVVRASILQRERGEEESSARLPQSRQTETFCQTDRLLRTSCADFTRGKSQDIRDVLPRRTFKQTRGNGYLPPL